MRKQVLKLPCFADAEAQFQSPLYRLPAEVREMIWEKMVGGRLIQPYSREARQTEVGCHLRCKPIWQSTVCEHWQPSIRSLWSCDDNQVVNQQGIWTFSTCSVCGYSAPKPSLQILRVSKQVFNEAYPIFWKTNTFSFSDPVSFESFIADITFNDFDRLHRVQIQVSSHAWPSRGWERASCASVLKRLGKLDFLQMLFCWDLLWSFEEIEDLLERLMQNAQAEVRAQLSQSVSKIVHFDHKDTGIATDGLFCLSKPHEITRKPSLYVEAD